MLTTLPNTLVTIPSTEPIQYLTLPLYLYIHKYYYLIFVVSMKYMTVLQKLILVKIFN